MAQNSLTKLKIGADESCDILITADTVSREHCELEWHDEHWWVTDLGSTNGTFVNGKRIAGPHQLSANDRLSLGRGVSVAIPPRPSPSRVPKVAAEDTGEEATKALTLSQSLVQRNLWPIVVGCVVLIGLGAVLWRIAFTASNPSEDRSASPESTSSVNAPLAAPDAPAKTEVPATTTASNLHEGEQSQSPGIWALVLESDTGTRHLLGTAIAIDPEIVVTLASVATAANQLKASYPKLFIVDGNVEVAASVLRIHPAYAAAERDLDEFRSSLAKKLESVDSTFTEPTLEERLEWSDRLNAIQSRLNANDLAILRVAKRLDRSIKPGLRDAEATECEIVGYPSLETPPVVTRRVNDFRLQVAGRLIGKELPASSLEPLMAQLESLTAVNLASLACIDANGNLLGLCGSSDVNPASGAAGKVSIIPIQLF